MLKKIILVSVVAVLMSACSKNSGYKITVKLDGAEGKVILEEVAGNKLVAVDSAGFKNGVAVLKGKVPYPVEYYLSVPGKMGKAVFFVENSAINITGNADSLAFVKVSGSATNDEFSAVNAKIKSITAEYMGIYKQAQEARAAGDTIREAELMAKVEDIYNGIPKIQEEFVKANPSSYVTPRFLNELQFEKSEEELDSFLKNIDPKLDSVTTIKKLKERIELLKKVAVGQTAPDFTLNDPDGKPIKFSDVYSKNELTLLDFWASWCGPCRHENPNVVAVFNQFKDKGFTVFGVSLDRDKDAWLKAVENDKLTWTHVSDLKFWNSEAAALYGVNSIPSNLLVDKTGKIIARNKREKELTETVKVALGIK